jgi:hypothetical protein
LTRHAICGIVLQWEARLAISVRGHGAAAGAVASPEGYRNTGLRIPVSIQDGHRALVAVHNLAELCQLECPRIGYFVVFNDPKVAFQPGQIPRLAMLVQDIEPRGRLGRLWFWWSWCFAGHKSECGVQMARRPSDSAETDKSITGPPCSLDLCQVRALAGNGVFCTFLQREACHALGICLGGISSQTVPVPEGHRDALYRIPLLIQDRDLALVDIHDLA